MWQTACPAFLCPESGSAAPGWKDRSGHPAPFFRLSPCLFLYLALSPVHRPVVAGGEPLAGGPWQSQQQPDNGEQRDTEELDDSRYIKMSLVKNTISSTFATNPIYSHTSHVIGMCFIFKWIMFKQWHYLSMSWLPKGQDQRDSEQV